MATHLSAGAVRAEGLPWPIRPLFLPLLYLWLGVSWWAETRSQIAALSADAPWPDPGGMAALAVAGRALAVITEGACYALFWRSRGHRLPFWRFTSWVAALSTADLLGFALRRAALDAPEAMRIAAALLAGPAALDPSPAVAPGLAGAFGQLGMLTLVRIGGTAWAQARGLGRSAGGPLALTLAAWLLTRLVAGWTSDLLGSAGGTP